MSEIKTATLLRFHKFITIILSYYVVMFWSSSSRLPSVSIPGSTSFVQSSTELSIHWLHVVRGRVVRKAVKVNPGLNVN